MALVGITGSLFKDLLAPTVTEATLKNALVKNSGLARDEIRQNQMITDLANPLDAFNKYKERLKSLLMNTLSCYTNIMLF